MNTLYDGSSRRDLLSRIARLSPEARPTWGRFNASEMIVHLAAQLQIALGDLPSVRKRNRLNLPIVRQLAIYVMPWPKGAPTAPELLAQPSTTWDADRAALEQLIARMAERGARGSYFPHPAFGRLTPRAWGVLAYRHIDHHLRQFGV